MSALLSFFFSLLFFSFFFLWPAPCGLGGLKFLNAWLLLHPLTIAIYKISKRGSGGVGVAEERSSPNPPSKKRRRNPVSMIVLWPLVII